jgi:hypothetical protein
VVGDAEAGGLDHVAVVRPVADRQHRVPAVACTAMARPEGALEAGEDAEAPAKLNESWVNRFRGTVARLLWG